MTKTTCRTWQNWKPKTGDFAGIC